MIMLLIAPAFPAWTADDLIFFVVWANTLWADWFRADFTNYVRPQGLDALEACYHVLDMFT